MTECEIVNLMVELTLSNATYVCVKSLNATGKIAERQYDNTPIQYTVIVFFKK